jgi:hypothetical protein
MNLLVSFPSVMASILRQELDSMVRVIYLLSIQSLDERNRLVAETLKGEVWTVITSNGKSKKITDREMVDAANQLHGWALSVYKFGCAFIHLSNFHAYSDSNPFEMLCADEQSYIINHLRHYHGGPSSDNPTFDELTEYFPRVFEKITGNLEFYLKDLESNKLDKVL